MRIWLLTALLCAGTQAAERPELPLNLLVFTHCAGFVHGSVPTSARIMTDLGAETGLWRATVTDDPAVLTADGLAPYDVVFAYTSGEVPISDAGKAALLAWVRDGGGWFGVHSATDTWYQWAEYGELIGGYFAGHPWTEPVTAQIEDPDHPAMRGLGASWNVFDEIYHHRAYSRDNVHVLMRLDPETTDWTRNGIIPERLADKDVALAWCREDGAGRVFYHALGHRDEVWEDAVFGGQLIGAVKWLARLDWRSDAALSALAERGDVAALVAAVGTLPAPLRDEPVWALASLGTPAAAAALGELASSPHESVRRAAVAGLATAENGLPGLLAASRSELRSVRDAAAQALGRRAEPEAAARLVELVGDPEATVRRHAVTALGAFHQPAAHAALLEVLRGDDTWLWRWALEAIRPHALEVRDELVAILRDGGPAEVLPGIVAALAPLATEEDGFALFRDLAVNGGGGVQEAAIRALATTGRAEVGELLIDWLFSDNNAVGRVAAGLLAQYPDLDTEDLLSPFIPRWAVLGPLPNENGNAAHDRAYAPEQGVDMTQEVAGFDGPVKWQLVELEGQLLNFRQVFPAHPDNAACYAYAEIIAPAAMTAELRLGSDDGCKAWLNGAEVLNRNVARGLTIDDDRAPIELRAGVNQLLVKVMQGAGDWSLTARIGRREGGMAALEFGPEVIALGL